MVLFLHQTFYVPEEPQMDLIQNHQNVLRKSLGLDD